MSMIGNVIRVSREELNEFLKDSTLCDEKVEAVGAENEDWFLDLGKFWEGIQYILTGEGITEISEPDILTRAFYTFQLLDIEQDLGHGPAQYLTSEQVKETSAALEGFDVKSIDGNDMIAKNIYPEIWREPEAIKYLHETWNEFKKFYKIAAEKDQAILTFVS